MILNRLAGAARLSALALAALVAACGGGGADTTPAAPVSRVVVMGDSLADVGTFGIKFTIQGHSIYPERVARAYGLGAGCNFFTFTGSTFAINTTQSGCSNYAIGGGEINGTSSGMNAADPRIISVQLATATLGGNFGSGDLLLMDGGGNDAAGLVTDYLGMTSDSGAAYIARLGTLLDAGQMATATASTAALGAAGATYMSALADVFHDQIVALALNKGAQRVAIVNMPGITYTPRFQAVLDQIASAYGGGVAGATARAQSETLFKTWVQAFNNRLASRFAGESRVVVVDLYTSFEDEMLNPAQYQLSNVSTALCASWDTCTDDYLSTHLPTGVTDPQWYTRYAFSDSFHPTPYGHQLTAQLIARSLARAGWL